MFVVGMGRVGGRVLSEKQSQQLTAAFYASSARIRANAQEELPDALRTGRQQHTV